MKGDGIECWLDQCHRTTEQNAAGQQIDHPEGNGEMHYSEGEGFGHGALQMGIISIRHILRAPSTALNKSLSMAPIELFYRVNPGRNRSPTAASAGAVPPEIGRASCRESAYIQHDT